MEEFMMTGYQWGDRGNFCGIYEFPANKDKYEVHMPPNTTLIPAPTGLAEGWEAIWGGEAWYIQEMPPSQATKLPEPAGG